LTEKLWMLLLEIGFLALLGFLYYIYQKRKILLHEKNKGPMIMGYILQSCLSERGETANVQMDALIEALDDYLHNKTPTPPTALLTTYAHLNHCSQELKAIIEEGLAELNWT